VKIHEKYIKRCIDLAKKGLGTTSPNPAVGSIIVYQNKIIGEGYTSPYGGNHAEVNAINSTKDKSLLSKATIYVSLEPCNHFGKTPPCSDLIVKYKIPNVVIGCVDPFEKVAGTGIEKLKANGCNVIVGVLEQECIDSNKRFFTYQNKKRPFIILKWAETKDKFISPHLSSLPKGEEAKPIWITNKYSQQLVHKWRAEEDAILIGTNTALNDNPKLNVRNWVGKNPVRIVLDRALRIPKNYHIYNGLVKTIILTEKKEQSNDSVTFERIDFSKNIALQICNILIEYKLISLFVEGGKQTLETFIEADLWDEARIFIGDTSFNKGLKAPTIKGNIISETGIKSDLLKILINP
jgi:diaminohydroxyphosphoribosylaminopyrimidine deaminase/5-amino-6-(5-phosphoribosylamino)uracil reductase